MGPPERWRPAGRTSPSPALLSPDGRTLYAVDYPTTIHVVDPARRVIARSVTIRHGRAKAPSCAATLSPHRKRLYVSALEGQGGDGIDVLDTRSLQPIAHFLPGRAVWGVATSPDGATLYASSGNSLITLDAKTGQQRGAVQVASQFGILPLALALSGP